MKAQELLSDLHKQRVVLTAHEGQLQIDAPKGIVTPAIRAELIRHKAELLLLLEQVAPSTKAAGESGAEPLTEGPAPVPPVATTSAGAEPEAEKAVSLSTPAPPWEG